MSTKPKAYRRADPSDTATRPAPESVADDVAAHVECLRVKVFETRTRYPHFELLLQDMERLSQALPPKSRVAIFERTQLYGGFSLIAPIFKGHRALSIDLSPASADARGAYNRSMVGDPRFIEIPSTRRSSLLESGLDDASQDLIVIPNLIHHVADQGALFAEVARKVAPGGLAYAFEPLVRELHQAPDDYLRYTPYGLEYIFRQHGLSPESTRTEGGPFQAVAYCWMQAVQYFPDDQRAEMERWLLEEEFPRLMGFDREYRTNNVRKNTTFPMSFSVTARKGAPAA